MRKDSRPSMSVIQVAIVVAITAVAGVVIYVLAFQDRGSTIWVTNSDGRGIDATSALATSDRMLNVAETTIITVLTLGAGLIGLNWYTSHRNYVEERQRFSEERRAAKEELASAVATVSEQLAPLAASLDDLRTSTQKRLDAQSWALAASIRTAHASSNVMLSRGFVSTIQYPLAVTARALGTVAMLDHTDEVRSEGREILALLVNQFRHVLESDQRWDISEFERYLAEQVSSAATELLDPTDVTLRDWRLMFSRFYVAPVQPQPQPPDETPS